MRKIIVLFALIAFIFFSNVIAQEKGEWVKILPEAERMQRIAIYATPEIRQRIPLRVELPGIITRDEVEKKITYKRLAAPGAGLTIEVGKPELPALRRFVKIPLGATASLESITSQSKIIRGYEVYPAQEPWAEFYKAEKPKFQKDERLYSTNAFFPKDIVRLGKPAILRGLQVIPIKVTPLQYNPVTKQLKVHFDIKWKVKYAGAAPLEEREKSEAAYTELFAPLYQRSIVNYRPPTQAQISKWITWPWLWKIDYLIITHDTFYESIKPLADAKKAKGLYVKIVKTSAIKPSGPTADEITAYIKKVYKSTFPRLSYVLLVGDADFIPTHYKHTHPSPWENNKEVGTDLYYSTMDGPDDYLPDIAIGRLPADKPTEVTIMVKKILEYEKSRKSRDCWFNCVLHCAYFQDTNLNGIADRWFLQTSEEIHEYLRSIGLKCTTVYTATSGSPATKYYRDGVTPVPATVLFDGSTQAIINGIDHGVFIVTHRNHADSRNGPYGASDGWGDPPFVTGDVSNLANNNEYPVFFSINCRSGWFDGETDKDGGTEKVDCLGEALLKKYNAGSSGFIGSTRISYSGYNDALAKGLIDALWAGFDSSYTELGANHLGDVLNFAKIYMAELYGYPDPTSNKTVLIEFEEFNLLGDPEMPVKPRWFILSPVLKFPKVLKYVNLPQPAP